MNWRWHKRASVYLVRVVTVMLVAALVGGLLLAFYQDYVSAAGNQTITRQFSPLAEAANTTDGDMDGFETTPTNAYADDLNYAVDTNSGLNDNADPTGIGTDKHDYYNYGLLNVVPSGANITGITVRADIAVDSLKNSEFTAIRLSWDGGNSWTAVKQTTLTGTAETTYPYGSDTDTWGRTWSTSELSDANFRVQVINGELKAQTSSRDFSLDWIPVSITFTAPWESYSDSGHTTVEDNFTETTNHVYMEGTGFATGSYTVGYYDANGDIVATDENISVAGDNILNSEYDLTTDKSAASDNWWYALVQPAGATPLPSTYAGATTSPDIYELMADDSFFVAESAIPEFPTVMAGIMVAGLCFGIYYWMRKRRLAYVKA